MMHAFNRIFWAAILAGGIAGLLLAGAQHLIVTPLIFEAETYEVPAGNDEDEADHHGEEAWGPEDGLERTFYTTMNSMLVSIGFGLLLTACYALRMGVTWRKGILWGLAGFAVFQLAPAFGLPPELPGDAAAGLEMRQVWWWLTVIATAIGLWVIAFQQTWYLKLFGVALIILPHLFGSPQPEVHGGLAPEDLRFEFRVWSLTTNAIFWSALGVLSAYFFNRIGESKKSTAAK